VFDLAGFIGSTLWVRPSSTDRRSFTGTTRRHERPTESAPWM